MSRKKLSGRKLDYDCKKRHGAEAEEIIEAERKFAESYQVSVSLSSLQEELECRARDFVVVRENLSSHIR